MPDKDLHIYIDTFGCFEGNVIDNVIVAGEEVEKLINETVLAACQKAGEHVKNLGKQATTKTGISLKTIGGSANAQKQNPIKYYDGRNFQLPFGAVPEYFGMKDGVVFGNVKIKVNPKAIKAFTTLSGHRYIACFDRTGGFLGYNLSKDLTTKYDPATEAKYWMDASLNATSVNQIYNQADFPSSINPSLIFTPGGGMEWSVPTPTVQTKPVYYREKTDSKNPEYVYTMYGERIYPKDRMDKLARDFGFSNYLPKRFLIHYELAQGQTYTLNEEEMRDVEMSPTGIGGDAIDVFPDTGPQDTDRLKNTLKGMKTGQKKHISWKVRTASNNSGVLGNFYVTYEGTLTKINKRGQWKFSGKMQMNDNYNFHPDKNYHTDMQKRGDDAEPLTRFANKYLTGTNFDVTSVWVPVTQTSNQDRTSWNGGKNSKNIENRVYVLHDKYNELKKQVKKRSDKK